MQIGQSVGASWDAAKQLLLSLLVLFLLTLLELLITMVLMIHGVGY